MPVDYSNYPADWKAISLRIRAREENKCKRCGVPNGKWIVRLDDDKFLTYTHGEKMGDGSWQAWNEDENGPCSEIDEFVPANGDARPVKIVLTVAHLNHDTTDNSDANLAALCQAYHLRHDAKYHAANAAKTRRRRKLEAGQEELFA